MAPAPSLTSPLFPTFQRPSRSPDQLSLSTWVTLGSLCLLVVLQTALPASSGLFLTTFATYALFSLLPLQVRPG